MLTFNLPHANRVPLHKRITSGTLSPRELSSMSSNDLASEEEQQSIRQAEQESLAHSILQRAVLPRAKITHKGLQDIEVDDPGVGSSVDLARDVGLPPLLPSTRPPVRAASGSVPPESPVVHTPVSATWGAPPPLPLDGMASEHHQHHHHHHPGSGSGGMSAHPLYSPAEPDFSQSHVEGELNLDDLIHMDDELADAAAGPSGTTPTASQTQSTPEGSPPATVPSLVSAPILTGISPFAASMPDMPPRASFDLNALWTAPKAEEPAARPLTPSPQPDASQAGGPDGDGDVQMDGGPGSVEGMEDVAEPQDQDFDMFLGKDEDEKPAPVAQTPQEVFDALPQVWSGVVRVLPLPRAFRNRVGVLTCFVEQLNMPLDSTIPQETHVLARQIGGRPLEQSSALWRTLFPAETLRIEGRVPVQNTAQYLVTSRMNALKEYIAVAFTPSSDADHNGFKLLGEFLINKEYVDVRLHSESRPLLTFFLQSAWTHLSVGTTRKGLGKGALRHPLARLASHTGVCRTSGPPPAAKRAEHRLHGRHLGIEQGQACATSTTDQSTAATSTIAVLPPSFSPLPLRGHSSLQHTADVPSPRSQSRHPGPRESVSSDIFRHPRTSPPDLEKHRASDFGSRSRLAHAGADLADDGSPA